MEVPTQYSLLWKPILNRLRDKAHAALAAAKHDPRSDGALWAIKVDDVDDELDIFAGRTTVVSSKRPSPSPALPAPQLGEPLPLITPPITIPIAPLGGPSNGGVSLADASARPGEAAPADEDKQALRELAEAIEAAVRGGKQETLGLDWGD